MKKSILLVPAMAVALLFSACSCESQQSSTQEEQEQTALQVDDVLAQGEELVGEIVTVEGVTTHVCSHGGARLFLMGSDDTKTIRVEAGEAIGSFPAEVVNSLVTVTGELHETRLYESDLQQQEERIKARAEEAKQEAGKGEHEECAASAQASGVDPTATALERVAQRRAKLAEREANEGKAYLSIFYVVATSYSVQ